jgi:Site-specific recombinases, DNA invertase Pin homologs
MKNVFAYTRVSGKGQIEGDGRDRQIDSIRFFCKSRNLQLLGEKFEAGVSGGVEAMSRPAFSELLEEIECLRVNGREVDGIVVERADRLARDLMVSEILLAECRKRNIVVYSADRGELVDLASDTADPTQTLIRQVLGALSQWQKAEIVMKTRKARERIRASGQRCEGNKPYGFYPDEKPIVEIFNSPVFQGISDNTRVRMLNSAGFTLRNGSKWNRFMVLHVRKQLAKGKV